MLATRVLLSAGVRRICKGVIISVTAIGVHTAYLKTMPVLDRQSDSLFARDERLHVLDRLHSFFSTKPYQRNYAAVSQIRLAANA